jgi:hypothetical protein
LGSMIRANEGRENKGGKEMMEEGWKKEPP